MSVNVALSALAWTLITVTANGEAHVTPHIPTRALAEEAKSIALTGMSLTEIEKLKADAAASRRKWDDAHPWREPKNKTERELSKHESTVSWGVSSMSSDGHGHVREDYQGDSSGWFSYSPAEGQWISYDPLGRASIKGPTDVKSAYIFPDDPQADRKN